MKTLNFENQFFQERVSKSAYLSSLNISLQKLQWAKLGGLITQHCDSPFTLNQETDQIALLGQKFIESLKNLFSSFCSIVDEITFYLHLLDTSCKEISTKYFAYHIREYSVDVTKAINSVQSGILKIFRNYVVCLDITKLLIETPAFYDTFDNLLNLALFGENGKELHVKYLLQCLINMASVAVNSTRLNIIKKLRTRFLWSVEQYFKGDLGHHYECSALIYNLWQPFELNNIDLICSIVLQHEKKFYGNYTGYLVEKILFERFIWMTETEIPADIKISLMSYLIEFFIDSNNKLKINILPDECIQYLISKFLAVNCAMEHLSNFSTLKQQVQQICQVIQLIGIVTSDEKVNVILKNNEYVFKRTASFLISINKSDDILQSLLEVPEDDLKKFVNDKPRFDRFTVGVKTDLVKILGNMCWKNRTMQDLARGSGAICAILDCLKIDDSHPFIPQWSIFAIRNLCENNEENQLVISQLKEQKAKNELYQ